MEELNFFEMKKKINDRKAKAFNTFEQDGALKQIKVLDKKYIYDHDIKLDQVIEIAKNISNSDKCTVLFLWYSHIYWVTYNNKATDVGIMLKIQRKNTSISYD